MRAQEAARVLGLARLGAKTQIWAWFYTVARQGLAKELLGDYCCYQIRAGLIGVWIWFTDGHLLPYTGKEKVHYSYNTQRRMPVPGRTNQVTCDGSGRIVDFQIEEGKGKMKQWIGDVVDKWLPELPAPPVAVFDREGYDAGFFFRLVSDGRPFVSWEKNLDAQRLGIGNINALFPRSPKYRPVVRRLSTPLSRRYRPESQPPEPGNCP